MPLNTGFSCISYVYLLTALYLRSVQTIPDDYCFKKFNGSDCGVKNTPVVYYFAPGSRCEVVYWRGCPTANMFESVYQCHHHCISRLSESSVTEPLQGPPKSEKTETRCDVDLVTDDCSVEEEMVYTFDSKQQACVEKAYYGCDTGNKFSDKHLCEKTCANGDWVNKVDHLSAIDLGNMEQVLEKVQEPEDETEHENEVEKMDEVLDNVEESEHVTEHLEEENETVTEHLEEEDETVTEHLEEENVEDEEDEDTEIKTPPTNVDLDIMLQNIDKNRCDVDLVTNNCSLMEEMVYTFDRKQQGCVEKAYYGCDTENKFSDKYLCEKTCADGDWVNKVEELSVNELGEMNELLDKVKEPENEVDHVEKKPSEEEEKAAWSLEQRTLPPDRDDEGDIFILQSPDLCLAPLNMSDCGQPPTPVFYYDKPGATCKVAKWRGCPSLNMFDSESQCVKNCSEGNKPVAEGPPGLKDLPQFGMIMLEAEFEEEKSILCTMIWNNRNCSKPPELVYHYDITKKACVQRVSYGCPNLNKFDDEKSCVKACLEYMYDWKARMEKLNTYLIKGLEADAIDLVKGSIHNGVGNDNRIDDEAIALDMYWLAVKENLPLGNFDDTQIYDIFFGKRNKTQSLK